MGRRTDGTQSLGRRKETQLSTVRLDIIVASVLSLSLSLSGQLLSLTDPGFDVTHGNALLHQRLGDLGLNEAGLQIHWSRLNTSRVFQKCLALVSSLD